MSIRVLINVFFVIQWLLPSAAYAVAKQELDIAYLTQIQDKLPTTSNPEPLIKDEGVLGAELAINDNNTTGQFTGQQFKLKKFIVPPEGNSVDTFNKNIAGKFRYLVTALPAGQTIQIADLAAAKQMLVFDVATTDDDLRGEQCRSNMLHLLPSRAMRADALGQYMLKKRWTKWFLVIGPAPRDRLFADAVKRTAKHLNIDIVAEKNWEHTFEARRSEQADVAVFTQLEDDYDVLVVADEQEQFGEYLAYRTWSPRPIIGTQGLTASAWHWTHEQWGAIQIQNRFKERLGRRMEEIDYGAYLAVRALGEAATRTKSNDLKQIKAYLLSDKFALQGYKGNPLSFRTWDGQLRQPVLLAAPKSLVAVAPIEGFLHPKTELDTLGYDQAESHCQWNKE